MNKWISTKDRLPEVNQFVLVYGNENLPNICVLGEPNKKIKDISPNINKVFYDVDNEWQVGITHWMPLPEPPQDKGVL